MCPRNHRLLALSLSVFLLSLIAGVATEQAPVTPAPQPTVDGQLRSEVSLAGRTATVAYAPALKASDPAHKGVLSAASGAASGRVRIGQLTTTGTLNFGAISLGKPDPAGVSFDLWLEGTSSGWQLQVTDAAKAAVGQIPLSRQASSVASPNLVAALIPENGNTARLVIRWGGFEGSADVQFADPTRRRIEENRTPNTTTNRAHDEDTSALSRIRLLAQRNETAFVLAKGARLSVSFQRTFARGERTEGNQRNRGLGVEGPDYLNLASTKDGAVVMLTESSVPRLRAEAPLRFGKITLATGNQVPGFPGSYGVWLKRVGSGWRLVFNNEPDAWGSQHDPKFDAGEVELTHTEGHAAARPFAVAIEPTAPDRGRFIIMWGPHQWTADFVVAG